MCALRYVLARVSARAVCIVVRGRGQDLHAEAALGSGGPHGMYGEGRQVIEIPIWYGWFIVIVSAIRIGAKLMHTSGKYPRQVTWSKSQDSTAMVLAIVTIALWIYWWPK